MSGGICYRDLNHDRNWKGPWEEFSYPVSGGKAPQESSMVTAEAKRLGQNCPQVQWYGFTILSDYGSVQSKVLSALRIGLSYLLILFLLSVEKNPLGPELALCHI